MIRMLLTSLALIGQVAVADAQQIRSHTAPVPNLPVVDQHGRQLAFYDDVIRDRVIVMSFMYTKCRDICPLTTARLALIADALGPELGKSVFFVSISVDPDRDTPAALKDFADAFQAGPGWYFLTGTPENIRAIAGRFGEKMRGLSDHRNEILVGNDKTGSWGRNSPFGDVERLVYDILSMDPDFKTTDSMTHGMTINPQLMPIGAQGELLFAKMCESCHALDGSRRVGPDLHGVTTRRSADWLTRFMVDPQAMHKAGDPTALELAQKFPAVRMPNMGLTPTDASDLIAYLSTDPTPKKTAASEPTSRSN